MIEVAVDTGGTFTDAILSRADGERLQAKVLSSSSLRATIRSIESPTSLRVRVVAPAAMLVGWAAEVGGAVVTVAHSEANGNDVLLHFQQSASFGAARDPFDAAQPGESHAPQPGATIDLRSPWTAPILAVRLLLGVPGGTALPPIHMRLATTRGTNALLERRLDRVLLVTNAGLGDALRIGDQRRPRLFALHSERALAVDVRTVEVSLRQDARGDVIVPLDEVRLRNAAQEMLVREGSAHAAIVLMHAWKDGAPERRVAEILRQCGYRRAVCSHDCSGAEGWLPRGLATLVDAALSTAVGEFLDTVRTELGADSVLDVMTSAGTLRGASRFEPRESLLSGPAGGAVSLSSMSGASGESLLGFDMGGTSTDACRVKGSPPIREQTSVAGLHLMLPSIAIESVAAGGGSICRVDDGALRVGPASAGAEPGPACYGRGGPLTVTDVDLLLGRAVPELFAVPIDATAARRALDATVHARHHPPEASEHRPDPSSEERAPGESEARPLNDHALRTLDDFRAIADAAMADAVRTISVRDGFDPAQHTLVAFGGAGGQHGCAIAEQLGTPEIVHPGAAGLLSALGIIHARREWSRTEGATETLSAASFGRTRDRGLRWLRARAADEGSAAIELVRADARLRLRGRAGAVEVSMHPDLERCNEEELVESLDRDARARYRAVFGAEPPPGELELEWLRLGAAEMGATRPALAAQVPRRGASALSTRRQRMRAGGRWCDATIVDRAALAVGDAIDAPALVADRHSTLVIDPGWRGVVQSDGAIRLRRVAPGRATGLTTGITPPEVLAGAIASLAIDMGEQLRRTAVSVNVRDRLDFSCGILDGDCRLVTNAPHVPVHLGALGPCVAELSRSHRWEDGDAVVTNHPDFGGSHLPDLTVVRPIFIDGESAPFAFVAARAHHAEIGGIRPGSMSPRARSLVEEGVIIPPTVIARGGRLDLAPLATILHSAPWPSRAVDDNLADTTAAVAALQRGADGLRSLLQVHGADAIRPTMTALRERSAAALRRAIASMPLHSTRSVRQQLDDAWPIEVRIERRGDRLLIDFAGSGAVHPGPFNAPFAVTRSAVMYAMRLIVESKGPTDDRSLPLNDGLLDPVDLRVPEGFLNPPRNCSAAVAAGNTETSQRVVDALLLALDLAACSQGTMNNLVMGSGSWSFYETIAGGHGATGTGSGASGMHAHMTNTRITDPEVLEARFPLRVRRFEVRRESGGRGEHDGGDGLMREIEFLEPCAVALVSQRRECGPDGLAGGGAGAPGRQRMIHADGSISNLAGVFDIDAAAGDRIEIETPGGGGFGVRAG